MLPFKKFYIVYGWLIMTELIWLLGDMTGKKLSVIDRFIAVLYFCSLHTFILTPSIKFFFGVGCLITEVMYCVLEDL
jgi:hypothetical protein